MNLDLNQDPGLEPASRLLLSTNQAGNLRRFDNSGLRRVVQSERLPVEVSSESRIESNHLMIDTRTSQIDEGSVGITKQPKALGTNDGFLTNKVHEKRDDVENDGSFFDCTVCFSLAKDPVVTTCGHLFCWPCIYRWLHMRPDVKECPVCKGGVAIENITPIYGKNTDTTPEPEPEQDASIKIPPRPQARRVESFRQFIQSSSQRIARRARDSSETMDENNAHETSERDNQFTYYSYLSSRGIRTEQRDRDVMSTDGISDLRRALRLSYAFRRLQQQPSLPSDWPMTFVNSLPSSVDLETYEIDETILHQALQGVDDGDSLSSIADRMNSESEAVELDSLVSSGRRNGSSGSADVDSSENSHPSTRRRLI